MRPPRSTYFKRSASLFTVTRAPLGSTRRDFTSARLDSRDPRLDSPRTPIVRHSILGTGNGQTSRFPRISCARVSVCLCPSYAYACCTRTFLAVAHVIRARSPAAPARNGAASYSRAPISAMRHRSRFSVTLPHSVSFSFAHDHRAQNPTRACCLALFFLSRFSLSSLFLFFSRARVVSVNDEYLC